MNTINLPDQLNLSPQAIQVYAYERNQESSKQQIQLNKNTFSFLQEGTKEVFFHSASYAIDNAQFLLMKSGHCLMTEKISNTHQQYRSLLLFFTNHDVLKFIRKFELTPSANNNLYPTYSFNYDPFIKRFVESLIDISKLSQTVQQQLLPVKFEEIMLYLTQAKGVDFIYALINNNDNHYQKFKQTIEKNQLNKLSIKELSFLSNMSISKFKREFEKHFNSSPSKWFQQKRLEHAAFLLKNNTKRPADIFELVGYESLANFSQAFKEKFGITPKKFQSH
jgi:AraC-like DNA-binding protein